MQALPRVRWAGSPAGDRGVALRGAREDEPLRFGLDTDLPPPRGALPLAQEVEAAIVKASPSVRARKIRERERLRCRRMTEFLHGVSFNLSCAFRPAADFPEARLRPRPGEAPSGSIKCSETERFAMRRSNCSRTSLARARDSTHRKIDREAYSDETPFDGQHARRDLVCGQIVSC